MRDRLVSQYESRLSLLKTLAGALDHEIHTALSHLPHIDRITFRVKGPASFADKALDPRNDPPYSNPLVEIEDQVGGRVIVFFLDDLKPVEDRLRKSFNIIEYSHRHPPADAEFGYESYHFIAIAPPHVLPAGWEERPDVPHTFELQLRTLLMHAYAEPQHNLAYKTSSELPPDIRKELAWIAASSWGADRAYSRVWGWNRSR